MHALSGKTLLYPIIGDPVSAARSPELLTNGFSARGHYGICLPLHVKQTDLDVAMDFLTRVSNVAGILVTMPHKFAVFDFCKTVSITSKLFGVVSVLRRNVDGTWHGEMTDGIAFVKAQKDAGAQVQDARVLLLGAGGAGSAIALALLQSGVTELTIHDSDETRTSRLIKALGEHAGGRVRSGTSDPTGCDMICNATPAGMSADDPAPLHTELLTAGMFVGDVIAGHGETKLLRAAREAGCKTANGDQMVEAVQDIMLEFLINQ